MGVNNTQTTPPAVTQVDAPETEVFENAKIAVGSSKITFPTKLEQYLLDPLNKNQIGFVSFAPQKLDIKTKPVKSFTVDSTTGQPSVTNIEEESSEKTETLISFDIEQIVMPIRSISDKLDSSWETVEGAAFGSLSEFLKWKLYKTGMGILSSVLPEPVAMAFKTGHFGGIAMDNPHDKLMFGGTSRRSFQLEWTFLKPDNKDDERKLNYIIEIFRVCSVGGRGKYILTPTPQFTVTFVSGPSYGHFLVYHHAVIQSCEVKFGGDGEGFDAMETGQPLMSLALTMNELEYPSRRDVLLNSNKGGITIE